MMSRAFATNVDMPMPPSPEEERELSFRALAGDEEARAELVERNARLVPFFIRRFGFHSRDLEDEDLVSEGNIGLIEAAKRFDPRRGARFATYAMWWVRQAISRAIGSGGLIRLPSNMVQDVAKWERAKRRIEKEEGRTPTLDELEEATGLDAAIIERAIASTKIAAGLGAPATEDGSEDDHAFDLADEDIPHAVEGVEAGEERVIVFRALGRLKPRPRDVLIRRYGLSGVEPQTLLAVAERYDVTRERIRQMEVVAIAKLRRVVTSEIRDQQVLRLLRDEHDEIDEEAETMTAMNEDAMNEGDVPTTTTTNEATRRPPAEKIPCETCGKLVADKPQAWARHASACPGSAPANEEEHQGDDDLDEPQATVDDPLMALRNALDALPEAARRPALELLIALEDDAA